MTTAQTSPRPVVLLFPGQGAQHEGMAVGLYETSAEFRDRIDEVFAHWGGRGEEIRRDWLAERPEIPLDDLRRAQPLLFAVDWALGRMVLDWGITPYALLGHSVGEVVAATLAGVLDLADAAAVMADRVDKLAEAPPGGMLAVAASAGEVEPYLSDDVALATINSPRQVMLAGASAPLAAVKAELTARGHTCRPVRSLSAFHSPVVAEAARRCWPGFARATLRPPSLRLFSGYAGGPMTDELATDAGFWLGQPAAPVLFWPALDAMLGEGGESGLIVVEAGPAQGLTSLARRHRAVANGGSTALGLLPAKRRRPEDEIASVRAVHSLLRQEGHCSDRTLALSISTGRLS